MVVSNFILVVMIMIFCCSISFFEIRLTHLFFVLGMFMLIQSIVGFIKKGSTKSLISIFEKVAIYEKAKMGEEWVKEQKTENILKIVLSGIMFLQSYSYHSVTDPFMEIYPRIFLILLVILILILNISMLMRFKKIDRSTHEQELNGYTKESNLMSIAIGLVAVVILYITIFVYGIS